MNKESGYFKFLILWSGDLISQIGGGLTRFGLGVYIFNRTGSAAQMALVTLLGYIPAYALSGVLADKVGSVLGIGVGRGSAKVIAASGILLMVVSLGFLFSERIRKLESGSEFSVSEEEKIFFAENTVH